MEMRLLYHTYDKLRLKKREKLDIATQTTRWNADIRENASKKGGKQVDLPPTLFSE